jgi:hypothetical protein
MHHPEKLLTVEQCAATFGLTARHWRHAAKDGSVPATVPSGRHGYLIRFEDAERHARAWFASNMHTPSTTAEGDSSDEREEQQQGDREEGSGVDSDQRGEDPC